MAVEKPIGSGPSIFPTLDTANPRFAGVYFPGFCARPKFSRYSAGRFSERMLELVKDRFFEGRRRARVAIRQESFV